MSVKSYQLINIKKTSMKVNVTGKITAVFPKREGVGKASGKPWASQDYALSVDSDSEAEVVVFNIFGSEMIDKNNLIVGDVVSLTLSILSKQYNGKYYPEIKAVECYKKVSAAGVSQVASEQPATGVETEVPF